MSLPPVAFGSPSRHAADRRASSTGCLGVLAGLEVMRSLNDAGNRDSGAPSARELTNEEGSRFAPAMMASAAYAGEFNTTDEILAKRDVAGTIVAECAGFHRLSRRRGKLASDPSAPSWNFISSRGRSWRPRARPSRRGGGQGIAWFDGR